MTSFPRTRLSTQHIALLAGLVSAGALTASVSCNVFDPSLYENAENTGGAGTGAAGTGGTATGGSVPTNWEAMVDWCPYPEELLLNSDQREHTGVVYYNTLANDVTDVDKLTGVDGPEGIIGFEVASFERVAITTSFDLGPGESPPPVDLALWLTAACGPDTFVRRNQRCPAGVGEDIWWQTNNANDFYLGIDTVAYDQELYNPAIRITVSYPRFGDGQLDKGEACDDGNLTDGDGCTHDGLKELHWQANPIQEFEPNNHPTAGNVVVMNPGQTMRITGYLGGSCDLDFLMFDVPDGSFPRVTVLGADGQPCPEGTPTFGLQFNQTLGNDSEQTKIGDAKIPAVEGTGPNWCPQFDETSFAVSQLTEGRYVSELKPFNQGVGEGMPFHYLIQVELLEPGAGTGGAGGG